MSAFFTLCPRISAEPIRQDVSEFGSGRMPMLRNVPLVSIYIGVLILTIGSTQAAQYGTGRLQSARKIEKARGSAYRTVMSRGPARTNVTCVLVGSGVTV